MIFKIDTKDKDFKKGDLVAFHMWGKHLTIGVISYSPIAIGHNAFTVAIRHLNFDCPIEKAIYEELLPEHFLNAFTRSIVGNDIPSKHLIFMDSDFVVKIKFNNHD